jgi:acetyl-CoA acetyltransferase
MVEVAVIGVGIVPFGRYTGRSAVDLAWPSVKQAIEDSGVPRERVNAAFCGSVYGGMMTGQRTLARLGMTGIPVVNVENACSSSATAFHLAHQAIAAGQYEVALVFGVDNLSQFGGGAIPLVRDDWEVSQGMIMPALYAMRARRYMYEHGVSARDLCAVSVKARRHGALNPEAQFRQPVTIEEVEASRMVADPLTLLQCCPTGDGAAAVVLCAQPKAASYRGSAVRVLASELTSGRYCTGFRDMTTAEVTVRSAREAYEMAAVDPHDIDVAEIHDAFSIAELMYYEAFHWCERGGALELLQSGATSLGGRVVVNPSGGLLAKGHPVGATGVAQIVEIVRQLRGDCGPRQVERARIGLTHATGGGASGLDHGACTVHIFGRCAR